MLLPRYYISSMLLHKLEGSRFPTLFRFQRDLLKLEVNMIWCLCSPPLLLVLQKVYLFCMQHRHCATISGLCVCSPFLYCVFKLRMLCTSDRLMAWSYYYIIYLCTVAWERINDSKQVTLNTEHFTGCEILLEKSFLWKLNRDMTHHLLPHMCIIKFFPV